MPSVPFENSVALFAVNQLLLLIGDDQASGLMCAVWEYRALLDDLIEAAKRRARR
jgi:hypothetical protein